MGFYSKSPQNIEDLEPGMICLVHLVGKGILKNTDTRYSAHTFWIRHGRDCLNCPHNSECAIRYHRQAEGGKIQ